MSKELNFGDGYDEVKYLDNSTNFDLVLTTDGTAFDLRQADEITVKIANDSGYIMSKDVDSSTITNPENGEFLLPVDDSIMSVLVPDDYYIEVWLKVNPVTPTTDDQSVTLTVDNNSLEERQSIFPSTGLIGFTIDENIDSDTGEVIPVITFDQFKDQFDDMMTQMQNTVSNVKKGDKGDKGDTGSGLEIKDKVSLVSNLPSTANEGDGYLVGEELYVWVNGAWKDCGPLQGPKGDQGIRGLQGKTGTGVSSTTIQYQISSSATVTPTGTWSDNIIATTTASPNLWMKATLNYTDGTTKGFYLVSQKGDKGDKGDTGDTGLIGPPGPVGSGLVVKGTVNNASQLPTAGNQEGYCYFVGTDLYVWDAGAWKNCGSVSPDLKNYVTVTDLNNGLNTKVNDNHNNTITANSLTYDLSKSGLTSLQHVSSGSFNDLPLGTVMAGDYSMTDGPDTEHGFTTTTFYSTQWGGRKVQIAIADSVNLMYFRIKNVDCWHSWTLLSDDSKVVHTTDMRKPASDVAGIEEVSAKQDKIGYTPADDSKVVHSTDTANWQKYPITDAKGSLTAYVGPHYKYTSIKQILDIDNSANGFYTIYIDSGTSDTPDSSDNLRGIIQIQGTRVWGILTGELTKVSYYVGGVYYGNTSDLNWIQLADDSKVAHLSGANNFDTVPTVKNNPLLLASSLPSDLARTGSDQEFKGKNTFDTAPIDKATGNPYITKDGVPSVPSTLADTTKDANFTGKLQKSGIDVATTTDVTNAVSTATANMVDSTKATNFTAGLQSGGLDVATAADIKSIKDSAWYQLDNKYIIPNTGYNLDPSTSILYKIEDSTHRLYLHGAIALYSNNVRGVGVTVQLGKIVKSILTVSVSYSGYNLYNSLHYSPAYQSNKGSTDLMFGIESGIAGITPTSGSNESLAYVTYDELV